MKIKILMAFFFIINITLITRCKNQEVINQNALGKALKVRQLIDTIGFAHTTRQMDSIISRLDSEDRETSGKTYKAVICPHDDYAYAAGLYNKTLEGIKSKTIVMIGVAHKARNFKLENKLVFDSFDEWKSTDNVKVSALRQEILKQLPTDSYIVHDSMMQLEHSLEAILPFLKKNRKDVEIIPILIPYITFENIDLFSNNLSKALYETMKKNRLEFGKDVSIVISNDAIHYGNEDWGGADMAPFGVDSAGNQKAIHKDLDIIGQCLVDSVTKEKIRKFYQTTVDDKDYKTYKWTWCGRYAVPFGLMLANRLNQMIYKKDLVGEKIGYRNSLFNKHIKVVDIGMGYTAPAKSSHWVGYAGVAFH